METFIAKCVINGPKPILAIFKEEFWPLEVEDQKNKNHKRPREKREKERRRKEEGKARKLGFAEIF